MPQRLREVMTTDPVTMAKTATLRDAAEVMRDRNIGDVVVLEPDGSVCGIVTDRDIVVKGIAGGADPATTPLDHVRSQDLVTMGPDDAVAEAVETMKQHAIRRLPIVDNGHLVGIVSLGDLAEERDPDSALGAISAAPANN